MRGSDESLSITAISSLLEGFLDKALIIQHRSPLIINGLVTPVTTTGGDRLGPGGSSIAAATPLILS